MAALRKSAAYETTRLFRTNQAFACPPLHCVSHRNLLHRSNRGQESYDGVVSLGWSLT